uniref:CCHC-type domain-containing protein n=1 Tax=Magallana gigas TaxID=29159 RepID=A0A8W8JGL6_MAGGI
MPNIKGEESDSESANPSGMAKQETSGERTAKQQETGGEEMTPDDMTHVWNALKKMKIRPENFLAWAASNSSTGLQPEPQSGTKQKVEVRKIEMEHPAKTTADKPKQALAKGATVSKTDTSVDEKFEELQAQINQLQSQQQYYRPPFQGNRQRPAFQRGRRGHPSSRGQLGYTYRMPAHPIGPSAPRPTNPQWKQQSDPVICYKCGQEGHIALGCRVRLDHLNARWSNPRDKGLTKAPRTKKLRTVRDQKVEAEEPPNQHNTDESDEENDFLYFAGQPPVVGDESDVLDDGRSSDAGTVTGDDQDSVQNLEEGLREDALNQSTDTDDPEVSTHVNNNNVVIPLQIVDDPDNAVRDQEHESDEIPERTPKDLDTYRLYFISYCVCLCCVSYNSKVHTHRAWDCPFPYEWAFIHSFIYLSVIYYICNRNNKGMSRTLYSVIY